MLKRFQRIIITIFYVIIVFFLIAGLIMPDKKMSEQENRTLTQFPELTATSITSGHFFSQLDDYLSDQFLFRDQFMKLKVRVDKIEGKRESAGVYLGHKGYLLAKNETPNKKALNNTVQAINKFTSSHENISMMIIPSSGTINPALLPYGAPMRDGIQDIHDFTKQLSKIQIIDSASGLKKYKNDYLYYKTDHHWTTYGAYREFLSVANKLGIKKPITKYKKYLVTDSFEGTLASESGDHTHSDEIHVYEPETKVKYYVNYVIENKKTTSLYETKQLKTKDQYTLFEGGNHPVVEINTTNNNHKNLLIFKDSYANSFVPFLYPYYQKIIMVDPRYYNDDINKLIENYDINQYLFLYSANTMMKDTSLSDLLNSQKEEGLMSSFVLQKN